MMRSFLSMLLLLLPTVAAWIPASPIASSRIRSSTSSTQLHVEPASSLTVASSAMATLDQFWQTSPYEAAAIACGFKASAADLVAQKNAPAPLQAGAQTVEAETKNDAEVDTDYKRTVSFLLYGSLYQGISQEFIYNTLYPVWFGSGNEIPVVLTKVAFDLLVQTTLVTLPMAYAIKGAIFGTSPKESLQKYVWDIQNQGLLQKYFTLWGPVQCLTFGVVPEHYRVTFIACVSFFWLIILSKISSNETTNTTTD